MGVLALHREVDAIGSFRLDLKVGLTLRLAGGASVALSVGVQTCGSVVEVFVQKLRATISSHRQFMERITRTSLAALAMSE